MYFFFGGLEGILEFCKVFEGLLWIVVIVLLYIKEELGLFLFFSKLDI